LTFVEIATGFVLAVAVTLFQTDYLDFDQWRLVVRDSSYRTSPTIVDRRQLSRKRFRRGDISFTRD
jgi:hypothetical protein